MSQRPGLFDIGQSLNEALALQRQGRLRDAEKIYARVLKALPDNFDALNLLGTVKAQLGRMADAQRLLSAAVKLNPRMPQAWMNYGEVLHALKRQAEALESFNKARALAPDDPAILNRHANALLSAGRAQQALAEFEQVLARAPQHVEARINCGIAQAALGAPAAALAELDRALALAPRHPTAHYNRATVLYELGRYADAVAAHDAVLAVAPDHAGAWLHRGRALAALNRFDEAIASYDKAAALRPEDADPQFLAAMALLTLGDYRRGFEKYEARWKRTGMPAQKKRGHLWLGEYPLTRKTVLLHAEQGLGDTIQFARYAPLVAQAGAKVVLEVQPELKRLMSSLAGAAAVVAPGEARPPYDVHCPLGSLPLAFKTELATVPAQIPYLAADEAHFAKWSARLEPLGRPLIALAWSGNPSQLNDRNRSMAFARLTPLLAKPAHFISIQRDVRDGDAAALAAERRITHLGGELESFSDTAAIMALADLVVTTDTSVANLAGAMGRPVWIMLSSLADWRWTLHGETTPWYPAARLFRQSSLGDWDGTVTHVGSELDRFIAAAR